MIRTALVLVFQSLLYARQVIRYYVQISTFYNSISIIAIYLHFFNANKLGFYITSIGKRR